MLGDRDLTLEQYMAILKRRRWWIVVPSIFLPILVYGGSLLIPNRYTSTTLVLVEEQKIPDEFVKPVVTEQLNERLATMQEQILSRTRLEGLIQKFGLFSSEVNTVPMEELVARMRTMITVTGVRADFGTRTGGLPGFYISFSSPDAHLAQLVCGEIASMFMEENLKAREETAQGTTEFLTNQLDEAKRKLDEQDAKLAQFKQKYVGQLPGEEQTNLNLLAALKAQLDSVNQAEARAEQDKSFAESLLAQQLAIANNAKSTTTTDSDTLTKKLRDLQTQLTTLQARYTDDYPDVIKVKREIADVQKQINSGPDEAPVSETPSTTAQKQDTPEIRQLRLQIHQLEVLKVEKSREQEYLAKEIRGYESRLQMSPVVEEQYKGLTRDYQTALDFYNSLLAKKTQSAMATDLERKQEGEQFRVMDPPNLPEKPTFPNRLLFAGGGLGGGLMLGFGLAALLEIKDKTLYTDEDVVFYLKLPVLTHVPVVSPGRNGSKRSSGRQREKVRVRA